MIIQIVERLRNCSDEDWLLVNKKATELKMDRVVKLRTDVYVALEMPDVFPRSKN